MARFLSRRFETDIELALAACAYFPSLEQAAEYLLTKNILTKPSILADWRDIRYVDRYREIRQQAAKDIEEAFVDDLMDGARLADMASTKMVERTLMLLAEDKISDPARAARDLQQVASQKVEKGFAISGRPTQIVEHRSFEEVARALVALGGARFIDGSAEEEMQDDDALELNASDG